MTKTIGMLGGMSWESSAIYYRLINQRVRSVRGGLHSASIIFRSLDFAHIATLQQQGDWSLMAKILAHEARALERAGADCVVLCTNTMHKVAPAITDTLTIPFVHIADVTATTLKQNAVTTVGLLGTKFTMQDGFYSDRLAEHGITTLVPDESTQGRVHDIIFTELCQGVCMPDSRTLYLNAIDQLHANGAQAVILGCTEIGLLINQQNTSMPLYDTTEMHAKAAVNYALGCQVDDAVAEAFNHKMQ